MISLNSSAYNIQFSGPNPIFIDTLSFKKYVNGAYWTGYKQFCEQFLCPLLLTSFCGVAYNEWYRGSLNGLDIPRVARLLPLWARFFPRLQLHIFLHAHLIERTNSNAKDLSKKRASVAKGLSRQAYEGLLTSMLRLVRCLKPKGVKNTYWKDYEQQNSYSPEDYESKRRIVVEFIATTKPGTVLDLGCNSGDFSEICLMNGARQAIGVDSDQGALEAAVSRAKDKKLHLLPLYLDLTNPSSAQGWASTERAGFSERVKPDALVALAVLHHLIIGKNIPMANAIQWLVQQAPAGLLEFVPKSDPMVQQMLSQRPDIFPDYSSKSFRKILSSNARIVSEYPSTSSGRRIFQYEK